MGDTDVALKGQEILRLRAQDDSRCALAEASCY